MKGLTRKARALLSCCLAATLGAGSVTSAAAVDAEAGSYEPGVWVSYYQGEAYDTYLGGLQEDDVNFTWTTGVTPPGMSTQEHFSTRLSGRILAPQTGTYIFYLNIDDGAKMWIDGELEINDAGPHGAAEKTAVVDLEAGQYYDFAIEHYNGYGDGTLQLSWRTPDNTKSLIPASAYYMPDAVDVTLNISGGTIAADGRIQEAGSEAYTLVLESYENGVLAETVEAERSGETALWSTGALAYEEGMSYKAYALDAAGEAVGDPETKTYGIDTALTVDADNVTGQVSDTLYGVCLEDVNHSLYGGIWSQMVFGESFSEPAYTEPAEGISVVGGQWTSEDTGDGDGSRQFVGSGNDGPKLILNETSCTVGEASADVYWEGGGPAGFIIKVSDAKEGADSFYGYEVGLGDGFVRLAKHENNYNKIGDYPCDAKPNQWNNLRVEMTADTMTVYVNGTEVTSYTDSNAIETGTVGFRTWDCTGKFKNIQFAKDGGELEELPVPEFEGSTIDVSNMWRLHMSEGVTGEAALVKDDPYTKNLTANGAQSQRLTFLSGEGRMGISNMGLNRMGMNFEAGKEYEGYFYARSEEGAEAYVVLENADGTVQYAETAVAVEAGYGWKKYAFTLTPDTKDAAGRLSIELRQPGSVDLAYVFMEPGEWGRFNGLHVRKDVAEALQKQNVAIIRFGGGMIGKEAYRWKNMLGAPEDRPTFDGSWNSYSSLGFGIYEFLCLCEELGIPAVPDFNKDETVQDMADFMDFALGTDPENEWVQLRTEMGHPEPFELPYLQIGNENGIDDAFATHFNELADAIWAKCDEYGSDTILIVGDFGYKEPIMDPYNLSQSDSGVLTLAGHKKILDHATEMGDREVWVDVHVFTDDPSGAYNLGANLPSLYYKLKEICPESKVKLTVFELNAWQHEFCRALGNAVAIMTGEKMSDVFPIICSANALQVDGPLDTDWDQGLVFMDSEKAWLQPAAYTTQMMQAAWQPNLLSITEDQKLAGVEYVATGSEDGNTVVVKLVNDNAESVDVQLDFQDFTGDTNQATVTTLASDDRTATNTADNTENITPQTETLENPVQGGIWKVTLPANSFVTLELTKGSEMTSQTLEEAKAAAEAALEALAVSNDTTADQIMAAVTNVITNDDITAAWTADFTLTPATADEAGSITGEITLTAGGETAVITVDKVIPQLEEIIKGDLDGDGDVDIQDVMLACRVLARKNTGALPDDDELARGDMNGDGKIAIEDIMSICRVLARKQA